MPPIQSNVNSSGRLKHSLTGSSGNEGSGLDWFLSLNRDFYHDFASHHSVRIAANTAFSRSRRFFKKNVLIGTETSRKLKRSLTRYGEKYNAGLPCQQAG